MSLGCARCGECCQNIHSEGAGWVTSWTAERLEGVPDPATDVGWAYWLKTSKWTDGERARAVDLYHNSRNRNREDAEFIAAHWTRNDDGETWSCDAFDPHTRLCTAHADRPPVCSGYPWYGGDPTDEHIQALGEQCSYLLDVEPARRPDGARPLIPLMIV